MKCIRGIWEKERREREGNVVKYKIKYVVLIILRSVSLFYFLIGYLNVLRVGFISGFFCGMFVGWKIESFSEVLINMIFSFFVVENVNIIKVFWIFYGFLIELIVVNFSGLIMYCGICDVWKDVRWSVRRDRIYGLWNVGFIEVICVI